MAATWTLVGLKSEESSESLSGGRSHVYVYIAIGTTATSHEALTASGPNKLGGTTAIPAHRAAHASSDGTIVTDKQARFVARVKNATKNARKYEITVTYSRPTNNADTTASPTSRPARISYASEASSEPYFIDAEDSALVNAAGEPFDALPERDRSKVVINIEKNYASAQWNSIEPLLDTVNQGIVTIRGRNYPAETLRLIAANETENVEMVSGSAVTFYTVNMSLKYDKNGHKHELLNVGYQELDGSARKPIKDADGNQVTKPWPLNADGTKKAAPDTAPDVLTFYPDELADWSTLPSI